MTERFWELINGNSLQITLDLYVLKGLFLTNLKDNL
jgi:hypothetical protein